MVCKKIAKISERQVSILRDSAEIALLIDCGRLPGRSFICFLISSGVEILE